MTQPLPDIEVAVSYQLHEYRQILRDYVATDLAQGGRLDTTSLWNWPIVQHLTFKLLVPLVFRWKKSRVGDCVFAFNASGLSRTSKGRTASRTWAQINQVHRLSTAYLIELNEGGAMPVPYRCFADVQRTAFDDLIEHIEAEESSVAAEHAEA